MIPEDVADRLACGADQIVATHTATGITYGRKRVPSKPMRRLLVERDGGCRFPGCGQKVRLHAHHVVFYSRDGKTSTKNLVMVCPRHHGAIHHRGWVVSGNPDTGTVSFTPPGGQPFTAASVRSSDSERAQAFTKAGVSSGNAGIQPRNGGERYDHHLTIWALTNQPANPPTAGPPPTPTPTPEPVDDASAETGRGRGPS